MLLKTQKLSFEDFLLDIEEKTLFRDGKPVSITPKVYDLLCFLVENHGHLVEKDVIMEEIWKDNFVEESNLTYTIRQLRKILDDDARNPKFIETIPRRGYRFIAEVSKDFSGHGKSSTPLNNPDLKNNKTIDDFHSEKSHSNKYLFQRNLLLFITICLLIIFSFLSINFINQENSVVANKNLSVRSLKTNGKSLIAVISPDGKYVAYTDETDEKVGLWLQNIETSEKKQILPPGSVYYFGLAFSNDGNHIYFVRRNLINTVKANIYRVSTIGGIPQKMISHTEGWISISPDDKKISFVRIDSEANNSLFIADADGKNEKKLITKNKPERIGPNSFSPDGKNIAFASGQSSDGSSDFRLMNFDLETKEQTNISPQTFFNIRDLVWMPDGKNLLITANESQGKSFKVWSVSKSKEFQNLIEDAASYASLSLDKKGERLLVTQGKNSFQISLFPMIEPSNRKILASANTASFLSNTEIAFSTDQGDIWKTDLNGKSQQQLTNSTSINTYPLISPDKNHIYFRSNRTGSNQIWRMDIDGSNQIPITKEVGGIPKFISKENRLIFESSLHRKVWEVSLTGNQKEKEVWDKELFYSAISSDGSRIAYLRNNEKKDNQVEIEIASLINKKVVRKISLAEKGYKPVKLTWLNDNETLLFITRDNSKFKLWKQNVLKPNPEILVDLGKDSVRSFSVSPDDKNFLLLNGEWLKDIVLIEGFNQ